jgi:hypothetical protein
MPSQQQTLSDFVVAEMKKFGNGYVGKIRQRRTGRDQHWDGPRTHVCTLEFVIEINKVNATRIEGEAEDIEGNSRFDWDKCKSPKAPIKVPFVWIPE